MKRLKLAPSKARIMNMSIPILIEHYSLVKLKISKLSSAQRKMVENRVEYHLNRGNISQEELDISLNNLKQI